jgi:hypothetical protein
MSHFCVLVVSNINDDIDELLEPYNENRTVEQYVSKTKAEVIEEAKERRDDFKNGRYAEFLADPIKYETGCTNSGHMEYIRETFPKILEMTDEELYQNEIKYYDSNEIGQNGEIYSTYNPDSKWDWYQVGGRYAGMLRVKEGTPVHEPNFSWGWESDEMEKIVAEFGTDVAVAGTVDFTKLHRTDENYNDSIRYWELIVEGAAPKNDDEREMTKFDFYKPQFYVDRYGDKETYAKCQSSFSTWAVLMDSVWYEKGEMGMFAMSGETHDEAVDWEMNFYDRFIKNLPETSILTIVDCHI